MADVIDIKDHRPSPWKISADMVQRAGPIRNNASTRRVNPFVIPEHPPGVKPRAAGMAMDDASGCFGSGTPFGWAGVESSQFGLFEGIRFLGWSYLAELTQRAEYRRISETVALDATRKWIELKAKDQGDKSDRISKMNDEMQRLDMKTKFHVATVQDGFFGRGHIYIDLGTSDNPDELKTPIGHGRDDVSKKKIGKNSLKALRNIEAMWCYPLNYNATDPLQPNWYKPEHWGVMGKHVDSTRLLTLIGRPLPDILKPAYSFGGLSLSQMMLETVNSWLRTKKSVGDIIHNFSVLALMTNMSESTQMQGDDLFRRISLFNALRDNSGCMALDKESEDLKLVATPLGSLNELQAQAQEHICAGPGIPIVKYTGIQPAGLNASSEGEIQVWHEWVHAYQELLFRRPIGTVLDFIQLSLFGDVDEDIVFDFVPLEDMDEKDQADIQKTKAETHQLYVDLGAIDQGEVRRSVGEDPDTPYTDLDIEDVPSLREEEMGGLEPIGGRPNPIEEQQAPAPDPEPDNDRPKVEHKITVK